MPIKFIVTAGRVGGGVLVFWNLLSPRPEPSFGGEWLHRDHYEMAAAYAYHLCQNHPFIDGNKRTALAAALVFLELNGITILDPRGRLKNAMIRIASGKMSKENFAKLLRKLPRPKQ